MGEKILIYTAITGSYDNLIQPYCVPEDFDFVCFVSKGAKRSEYEGAWRIEEIPYEWGDMTLLARSQKLNPHTVLPVGYDYSLWIDGNIAITGPGIYDICRDLARRDVHLALIKHPFRDCVYDEMERVLRDRRESLWRILKLVTFLAKHKFARHSGLMETNMIFRRHNAPEVIEFDRWWWECLIRFTNRDQLTQSFALHDTENIECELLLPEGFSTRNFEGLEYHRHKAVELSWMQRKLKYGLNGLKTLILRVYIKLALMLW